MRTELSLVQSRMVAAGEQTATAAARLAEAVSADPYAELTPADATAVPLDWVSAEAEKATLIATGLQQRPELKQAQALVAAVCQAYRREKIAPFVPSVLLGFSTGGFGGGFGNELDNVDTRYDFDAVVAWRLRNLGYGEAAARSGRSAEIQQAKFEQAGGMDRVAREVSESFAQVRYRRRQIAIAEQAIESARQSYRRDLQRIREGEGLPLEVLQSVQALETASLAYLRAVADYNHAQLQLQLQWAQGWPLQTPAGERFQTPGDQPD